jgi:hypothetical protein
MPSAGAEFGATTAATGGNAAIHLPGVDAALLKGIRPYRSEFSKGELLGAIDWSAKRIIAVGWAKQETGGRRETLMARRAAELVALRNAMVLAAGIHFGPGGQIEGLSDGRAILEGYLKDYEIARAWSVTKKSGEIDWYAEVSVPLFGVSGLSAQFYGAQMRANNASLGGMKRLAWPEAQLPADGNSPIEHDVVMIDARETDFTPCLYPALVADGQIVLDIETVGREVGINFGFCAIASAGRLPDHPDATTRPTGKGSCHVFKAVGTMKNAPTVLLLSDSDAQRLIHDPHASSAARNGRVVILVGPILR